MRPQPLIAVHDVEASSRWYQHLFGWESGHGGKEYERLVFEGEMMLQLHSWSSHEHPNIGNATNKPYGNGVLLWYQIVEFDVAVARARSLKARILEEPHVNQNAQHRECWIHDPDGYVVVMASCHGDLGD